MPYKSNAQRKFMHAAMDRGEIKPSTVKEFDEKSKGKTLPQHVKHTMPKIHKFLKMK